jgi:flagellar M-ring protein FliF
MKQTALRSLQRAQKQFGSLAAGQKAVAIAGIIALLLATFMVFRWTTAPSYQPLFSNLAPEDASVIVDKLETSGVPYKLENAGATISVPSDQVYKTRIAMSGEGLPASSDSGYALLDDQSLSTSQFQEQTDFKRAMEGELAKTIGSITGVNAAVVHLAIPTKRVFASEQDPTTASVLVKTAAGRSLDDDQVQAIVNLVASSVDGLEPDRVTVADATGKTLSAPPGSAAAASATQDKQTIAYQARAEESVQKILDQVLGAGNGKATVNATLDFDKTSTKKTEYNSKEGVEPLSQKTETEDYNGTGTPTDGGVVGPDGALTPGTNAAGGDSEYKKESNTRDNAVDKTEQVIEAAPGTVKTLHVGVVVDEEALAGRELTEVEELITSSLGINTERGDTVKVSAMPFDKSSQKAAADELAKAEAAEKKAKLMKMVRDIGLAVVALIAIVFGIRTWRRRSEQQADEKEYMLDRLIEASTPVAKPEPAPAAATALLDAMDQDLARDLREEILDIVERQPEDVAQMVRTWLVESDS